MISNCKIVLVNTNMKRRQKCIR